MHTINNLDIVKVNELFRKCQLSLSCWLLETCTGFASSSAIVTTIGSCKLFGLVIELRSSCDSATPNDVKAIVINRDAHILGLTHCQLILSIIRFRVYKEALADWARLNAL
jgi:hypothetical protein